MRSQKSNRVEEVPLHVSYYVDLIERAKQRQIRLEGFIINCDDENAYEHFIKELISFEEELIMN